MPVHFDDFASEKQCVYKGELFTVRDNGAVFRHARDGKRLRKDDNRWTFGEPNQDGYLVISSIGIQRIVATAFHGEPAKGMVADHIDTNRKNNRPGNLRWVTRLENIILNPFTAKKIAHICGSVEAFLSNPGAFDFPDADFRWMKTVTESEAQNSKARFLAWAEKDNYPSSGRPIDDWIFRDRYYIPDEEVEPEPDLVASKTPNAVQRHWITASEFPCCPQTVLADPIGSYAKNLETGNIFCRNIYNEVQVVSIATSIDNTTLWVLGEDVTPNAIKPWLLGKVTYENDLFVHSSVGSYFERNGAEKNFALAQGQEWSGGNTLNDFC
ncbi:HNH endonuclease signature motif containing protein [Chitinophaga rhizophila]|uniref:HNH endonuclease n=1 Tax=Chitinophaga rhizophila TaxID=2866212 RepID=A0ABS7G7U1_9BACT|nr:HNH endonuclease signature motif containing protein [Chitinophaga rhizophila]MBW8683461.1 HNH endonuclease [Chitinophaga rhizophila]